MAIKTRKDEFTGLYTDIVCKEIYKTSRLVSSITGMEPQANKSIVGKNAFLHESGIHQDGVLKHPETYEIIKASDIGLENDNIVLGKHSGRHAVKSKLETLGFDLSDNELNVAFERFKILADQKKDIFDDDLRALVTDEMIKIPEIFEVITLSSNSCNKGHSSASITIRHKDKVISDSALGNGSVDSIFKAVDRISNINGILKDYQVKAVSSGKDAMAKVTVKVEFEGMTIVLGHGLDVDTMLASAKAYVSALNSYLNLKK